MYLHEVEGRKDEGEHQLGRFWAALGFSVPWLGSSWPMSFMIWSSLVVESPFFFRGRCRSISRILGSCIFIRRIICFTIFLHSSARCLPRVEDLVLIVSSPIPMPLHLHPHASHPSVVSHAPWPSSATTLAIGIGIAIKLKRHVIIFRLKYFIEHKRLTHLKGSRIYLILTLGFIR